MTEMNGHAEFEQLLLLVDASEPTRATRSVRRHVATCWKCRTRLEELQETVHEFARYHEKVVLPNFPAAPQAWPDLRRRMRESDESTQIIGLWSRVSSYFSLPAPLYRRLLVGIFVAGCCALAFAVASRKKPVESPLVTSAPVRHEAPPAMAAERTPIVAPVLPKIGKRLEGDSEVQVFRALHEVEADLGDPVEVSRASSGEIKVVGTGVSATRQDEIRGALQAIPGVTLEWHDSAGHPEARLRSAKPVHLETGRNPFEELLRSSTASQFDWENLCNRVLDESDSILARAHALRTLEDHFSEPHRQELAATDRDTLDQIASAHRTALADQVHRLDALLAAVVETTHASPLEHYPDLLAAAQRVDRIVSIIFGGAATAETPSQVLANLSHAVADLNAAVGDK